MPSSRRRRSVDSESEEEQLSLRNNSRPRRGKTETVNYAVLDDNDDNKMEEEDVSDVEILSDVEDDFLDEMEDEVVPTRRSARGTKRQRKRRVSDDCLGTDDELSATREKSENDSLKKKTKSPKKSPAHLHNNRLSIESFHSNYEFSDQEDEDDSALSTKASKRNKKEKKAPKEVKEFEPFRISKTIAALTLNRTSWSVMVKEMHSSEIEHGSRWFQEPNHNEEEEETRYLIKWNDLSYAHCSWETEDDLLELVEGAKISLTNFLRKCDEDGKIFDLDERNDGQYFDPSWLQIDRILEVHFPEGYTRDNKPEQEIEPGDVGIVMDTTDDGYEKGLGRQFLIKWGNRPYSDCSYEFERDLILVEIPYKDKVAEFNERSARGSDEVRQQKHDMGEAEFRRLYKDVFGERSESKSNEGVEFFQKALVAHEYPNGGRLRDYQAEGVAWLVANTLNKRSCILADEMGLGKTIQVAALLGFLATKLHRRGPFLIVVPLSTVGNWKKECDGWLGLNTIVYHGTAQDREMIRKLEMAYECDRPRQIRSNELFLRKCAGTRTNADGNPWMFEVVLTTPELLCAGDFTELTSIKWECLVVDEAQKLKNYNSKLSVNLRDPKFKFKQKVLLTGTPIQNTMEELFSLLSFIDPMLFPDCDEFMGKYGEMKTKEVLDALHEEIGPYILRRLKEDVEKSVPPKEETIIEVELTVAQKQYYRALYEKNVKFLHKNKKKAVDGPSLNNLAMQLRKCCNHLFLLNGIEEEHSQKELSKGPVSEVDLLVGASGKLVLLDKLLPRLKENGHRILIFSQFARMLNLLEDYMFQRGWNYERIDGSITGTKRQQAIERFQDGQDVRKQPFVMLLTTRAGGVGINLTAADTCIIFDSDWNPQNDLQAQARCHRIGQTKDVKVYRLLTRSTYEQQMFKLASQKLGLDQAVLSGFEGKSGSGSLTKEEVEKLLRHGAYLMNETEEGAEAASNAFLAQDIDTILGHSRVVVHKNTGSGSSATGGKFSKARFSTTQVGDKLSQDHIDVSDPDFWKKMLGDVNEDVEEAIVGKRSRTVNNYCEEELDKKFNENYDLESDQEEEEGQEKAPDDVNDDDSFVEGEESESESEDDEFLLMQMPAVAAKNGSAQAVIRDPEPEGGTQGQSLAPVPAPMVAPASISALPQQANPFVQNLLQGIHGIQPHPHPAAAINVALAQIQQILASRQPPVNAETMHLIRSRWAAGRPSPAALQALAQLHRIVTASNPVPAVDPLQALLNIMRHA